MHQFKLVVTFAAVIGLASCGQKDVSSEVKVSENGQETKVSYLKREALQPYEKYTPFKTVNSWVLGSQDHKNNDIAYRNFYWSSAPINYELLAYDFVDGYADETDAFKKKDMIKNNKDKLELIYQNFPKNKYFAVPGDKYVTYAKYNEEEKGFPIRLDAREGLDGQSLYELAVTEETQRRPYGKSLYYTWTVAGGRNTEAKEWNKFTNFVYIPKNEEEARAIEAELSAPQADKNIRKILLGRTIGARFVDGEYAYGPIFMIDGVALVNEKTGKPLLTISKNELGDKYEIKCSFTDKALGLEEIERDTPSEYRGKVCGQ